MREARRRQNRDSSEQLQHQQIFIAGNDQVSPAIHRQLEESVVSRVPAGRNGLGDGQHPRKAWPAPSHG
jgi:hypothetical protein